MQLTVFALLALCVSRVFGARILGVFPAASISHQFFFQPIWRELSLHGHEVVVLTPNPLNDKTLVNLTEIDASFMYEIVRKRPLDEVFPKHLGVFSLALEFFNFAHGFEKLCFEQISQFKELIEDKNQHFDLVIVEGLFPMMYGLAHRFNAPVITALSIEPLVALKDYLGVPSHLALNPCMSFIYEGDWTLTTKIKSVFYTYWQRLLYKFYVLPRSDREVREHIGDEMPYLETIIKNSSLSFINSNFVFNSPRPIPPNYVELSQMHIKPVKPLPKDLKELMDNATEGIIYFSLGSNVQSSNLPLQVRKTIMDTLSELPYKVLWKFETDDITDIPKNVITRKWFPQQDVLAHPNVKAFVTQGGIQSLEEAISRDVPVIGLPFFGDQPINIKKIVDKGMGLSAEPTTVTKEELKKLIVEVAENSEYRKRVKEMHKILLDQPMNSTEKIIWWTEYVLRHKGASHFRNPIIDASFIEYYLVDVFIVVLVLPLLFIYVIVRYFKHKLVL